MVINLRYTDERIARIATDVRSLFTKDDPLVFVENEVLNMRAVIRFIGGTIEFTDRQDYYTNIPSIIALKPYEDRKFIINMPKLDYPEYEHIVLAKLLGYTCLYYKWWDVAEWTEFWNDVESIQKYYTKKPENLIHDNLPNRGQEQVNIFAQWFLLPPCVLNNEIRNMFGASGKVMTDALLEKFNIPENFLSQCLRRKGN